MKTCRDYIVTIPNFPKEGIMFRDVTSIIGDAEGFQLAVDEMKKKLEGIDFDVIVGIESRGYIFGAPLAYIFNKPLVLVRKKGKLPRKTICESYALEYGTAEIEIHEDAIKPGQKAILIDDLIATGGTVAASCKLVERLGGEVAMCLFLMELKGLKARELLKDYRIESVVDYEGI